MNAIGAHMDDLMREIAAYLAFMDEARERDSLWEEYCAWKKLTDSRLTLKERLTLYTMR